MSTMEKGIVYHRIPDDPYMNDLPSLERWIRTQHRPEVLNQAPWFTQYLYFRSLPNPKGATELGFGWCNWCVHENMVRDREERRGVNGLRSFSPWPEGTKMYTTVATVPAEPTEDFFGATLRPSDTPVIRWQQFIRYPENVLLEEAEKWFLNIHVPEVIKQPGLLRFFSHKALPNDGKPPVPGNDKQAPYKGSQKGNLCSGVHWDRVNELWYADGKSWTNAIIENPPEYSVPKWATCSFYPFFKPGEYFADAFLLDTPDSDLLQTSVRTYY